MCQNTRMRVVTRSAPLKLNKGTHTLGLFFMSGFDDSVSIYLNKKLIQHCYIKSLFDSDGPYLPMDFTVNCKINYNLLELKKTKSQKRYYTYLTKGFSYAVVYLENDSAIVYTNRPPMNE